MGNVLAGGESGRYPEGNVFPDSLDAVPFVDRKAGNYRLAGTIKHLKGSGVDGAALCAALSPHDAGQQPICVPRTAETGQGRSVASQSR
jgi:hypothetical protein